MNRLTVAALLATAVGAGACWLLPDRYAVNAPMLRPLLGWSSGVPSAQVMETRLRAAEGFHFGVFARDLSNARFMRITPSGDIPTLLTFSLPMVALYLIGIGIAWIFGRPRREPEAGEA